MWIFGYGSLVWKVDFPYVSKVIGYIKGYERRFWQASIDHRGTPEKPGRVVTLVPSSDPEAKVWGVVYQIHSKDMDYVIEHLDLREIMGYEKVPVLFHAVEDHPLNHLVIPENSPEEHEDKRSVKSVENLREESNFHVICPFMSKAKFSELDFSKLDVSNPFEVIMYYGSDKNEHYLGPASSKEIAERIYSSIGPSGTNKEYLCNLSKTMKLIRRDAFDVHLEEIQRQVDLLDSLELEEKCT